MKHAGQKTNACILQIARHQIKNVTIHNLARNRSMAKPRQLDRHLSKFSSLCHVATVPLRNR